MTLPRPIVILGPTAGGKSDLAVGLAERLDGQVIGADSMQVYRGMDAGTAKPSNQLRARAVHHLIDIVEPTERFTLADWLQRVEPLIAELGVAGKRAIIVGGTNLYLKGLLEGMFDGPEHDESLRAELVKQTGHELHARLAAVDPASAQRIHPNDMKKLVRAIEVFALTGKPISALQTQWSGFGATGTPESDYRHNPVLIGLEWPVDAINRRINARVKEMFHPTDGVESLPDETRRLENLGLLGPQAREALGYKQVLDYLQGRATLDEAFEKTKILTRRFAKSQRTWLKRFRGVTWLPAAELSADEILNRSVDVANT